MFKASRGMEDIYELNYIRMDVSRFPAVLSVTAMRGKRSSATLPRIRCQQQPALRFCLAKKKSETTTTAASTNCTGWFSSKSCASVSNV